MDFKQTYKVRSLVSYFQEEEVITFDAFREYFHQENPELQDNAILWRLHSLKKAGLIQSVGRGKYSFEVKVEFVPPITPELKRMARRIKSSLDVAYCLTSGLWFNEWSTHQMSVPLLLLEVEKDWLSTLFEQFRQEGMSEVYLNPDEDLISRYVSTSPSPIVLKPLLSRAPIQRIEQIWMPTLEKLLVDLFCDPLYYWPFQGAERVSIFQQATTQYHLDYSRLLNYARRRNRYQELRSFLKEILPQLPKALFDD